MWAKSSWCLDQRKRTRMGAGRPSEREKLGSHVMLATRSSNFILYHHALPSLPQRSPW